MEFCTRNENRRSSNLQTYFCSLYTVRTLYILCLCILCICSTASHWYILYILYLTLYVYTVNRVNLSIYCCIIHSEHTSSFCTSGWMLTVFRCLCTYTLHNENKVESNQIDCLSSVTEEQDRWDWSLMTKRREAGEAGGSLWRSEVTDTL